MAFGLSGACPVQDWKTGEKARLPSRLGADAIRCRFGALVMASLKNYWNNSAQHTRMGVFPSDMHGNLAQIEEKRTRQCSGAQKSLCFSFSDSQCLLRLGLDLLVYLSLQRYG